MKTETFQLPWGDVQVVYPEAEGDEVLRALRVARLETEQKEKERHFWNRQIYNKNGNVFSVSIQLEMMN